jgi:predicted CXXCH cytochrome family protein
LNLTRFFALGLGFSVFWAGILPWIALRPAEAGGAQDIRDPDAVCASCHKAIYERYRRTPMANASGPAAAGFIPADFEHVASGIHYRMTEEAGRVWLSYTRHDVARPLDGRQQMRYFLGSGRRGRTYLFEQNGYWFEAPINWYAKKQVWDMTPHYLAAQEMPLTLPVDPGCLHCHASVASSALPDARNHYAGEPFGQGGILCEACHGDARAHVARRGKADLIDIDGLPPDRRDSVCLECHLEGQAGVDKLGKRIENFKPGDDLFDYTVYFVYRNESGSGGRATSQWEALLKSACKRVSGDKMTCTTCHDPHGSPPPEERVAFYRARCLSCHREAGFAEKHHPENPDCTACHMARPPSNDIAHEQVTDHWIKRRVSENRLPLVTSGDLVPVGNSEASDRDLGLAYAQMAARGDRAAGERALELLLRAEHDANGARDDHELHAQLGFLEQIGGKTEDAAREYREALAADSFDALAAGDLALIEAERRNDQEAIRLWSAVMEHDPAEVKAGMNLAITECAQGKARDAETTLERLLEFSPDDQQARIFAARIRTGEQGCVRR